jgi:general stress protein 26
MAEISSNQVWEAIHKQLFAVLGMVTKDGEARTVGIVYIEQDGKLYITSKKQTWKIRHIVQNPHVSLTVPIHKRIPFLPWIKIPAATITFSGTANLLTYQDVSDEIIQKLFRGIEFSEAEQGDLRIIEVTPVGDFITYGIGVPMMKMREPEKARGKVAVVG